MFNLSSNFQEGHVEVVKYLIEKGANLHLASNNGGTPLYIACEVIIVFF